MVNLVLCDEFYKCIFIVVTVAWLTTLPYLKAQQQTICKTKRFRHKRQFIVIEYSI